MTMASVVLGVPLRIGVSQHSLDPHIFVATAAAIVNVKGVGRQYFFGGAARASEVESTTAAAFEVVERLYATRWFCDAERLRVGFDSFCLGTGLLGRRYSANEVLVRERNTVTASGLSVHVSREKAVTHATLELLERHMLCRIWYENAPMLRLDVAETVGSGYTLELFGVSTVIPFVIAVLTHQTKHCFVSGSSVSLDINAAKVKARNEALQLFHSATRSATGSSFGNPVESSQRVRTLLDERAAVYKEHFFSRDIARAVAPGAPKSTQTVREIIASCEQSDGDFSVIPIKRFESNHELVRVVNGRLLNKVDCRVAYGEKFPEDPFC
jgi:hypothetical protein